MPIDQTSLIILSVHFKIQEPVNLAAIAKQVSAHEILYNCGPKK